MARLNRVNRVRTPMRACCACVLLILLGEVACAQGTLPTNNDPTNQIRFNTGPGAAARRAAIIDYIWDGPLPTAVPTVTVGAPFPDFASDINPANVARVDRLDADVSGWDYHATSYLLHPTKTVNANRPIILHQGHDDNFNNGRVAATANFLLEEGFSVVLMMMPLYGWNTDTTANIPGYGEHVYSHHNQMIENTQPYYGGDGHRFFLEPVVQNINYLYATKPDLQDVNMIGLSGGGWTTSMMAAIDERIQLSVSVAGTAPFYVANNFQYYAYGDGEQVDATMFNEDIAPDGSGGGFATYLEIYTLGGYGTGRRQIQSNNQFDVTAFNGTFADTYKDIVSEKVDWLGGSWEHYLDTTTSLHQISEHLVTTVLFDALHPPIVDPSMNPADLDDNLVVDASDIDILWSIIRHGGDDPGADDDEDFDGDGVVNVDDLDYMLRHLMSGGTWMTYGDANLNGGVGGFDFQAWRQRAGTGWANGDFNGDGGVGGLDFTLWRLRPSEFPDFISLTGTDALIAPEPTSLALLTLGWLTCGLWEAHRRRRAKMLYSRHFV